jgi:hypothetical protein
MLNKEGGPGPGYYNIDHALNSLHEKDRYSVPQVSLCLLKMIQSGRKIDLKDWEREPKIPI